MTTASEGKTCLNCQHSNPPSTKFCHSCGALLEYSCSACGAVSPQGSRACAQCGRSFVTAPPTKFINPNPINPTPTSEAKAQAVPQPTVPSVTVEKMERICSGCGSVNGENDRFCFKCGIALGEPTPIGARKQVTAGFVIRLGAYLVDQVVLFLVGFVAISIMIEAISPEVTGSEMDLTIAQQAMIYALGVAINMVYYTIAIGKWGRTIGKQVFGLQVLTVDGKKVSYFRAFIRSFGYYLSALTLFFGFLMIAWNKQARGLHDLLAGTIVIRRNL